MSQEELAKAIGVDESSIAKWEAGRAKPMRRSREKLKAFFGSRI
ncbi:MAG: helix-turn-helix transcriptional regulator [Elusimicrobia bacterium]|nr:helix-turn-helix transcriptional regulator [Elusimicrobiota bacterium]